MGKASRTKQHPAGRNKTAAYRAAQRRAQVRSRVLLASGAIVVVIAIMVAFAVIALKTKKTAPSSGTGNGPTGAALATVVSATTSVPASILDAVGAGSGTKPPAAVSGPPLTSGGLDVLRLFLHQQVPDVHPGGAGQQRPGRHRAAGLRAAPVAHRRAAGPSALSTSNRRRRRSAAPRRSCGRYTVSVLMAHLAPPLSEEQKARLAVLLAPAVEEAQEDALTSGRQDVAQVDVRNGITCAYGADLRDRLRVREDRYGRWR